MTAAEPPADRYALARTVLSELPCPVVIIGAGDSDERSCATGTAMYSSFFPPAIVVAIHPGSRTCRLIEASGRFSVSLLAEGQVDEATAAGRSATGRDKFAALGIATVDGPDDHAPAVKGAALIMWCRVTDSVRTGDHVVFNGELEAHQRTDDPAPPLLRHQRRYLRRGEWITDAAADGYPT